MNCQYVTNDLLVHIINQVLTDLSSAGNVVLPFI